MLTQTDLVMSEYHRNRALERWRVGLLMCLYCLGILLLLDMMYSNFIYKKPAAIAFRRGPGRTANNEYHHDLAPNTNSLGFKDGSTRIVPLVRDGRRVLLIGDSFTEGVGVPFDQTFAGLLYQAGLEGTKKVEFLNAAVRILFAGHLLQEDQVSYREGSPFRRGRGFSRLLRSFGRGREIFLYRRCVLRSGER
jgi:hypothetical protein